MLWWKNVDLVQLSNPWSGFMVGQMPYYLLVTVGLEKKHTKSRTKGPGKHSKESRCTSITALLVLFAAWVLSGTQLWVMGRVQLPAALGPKSALSYLRSCTVSVDRAGRQQHRGGEWTASAVPGNSAAAVTVEPHRNAFVSRKVKLVIFLSLWHISRKKLVYVSTTSGVLIAAIRRMRGKEIPFALLSHPLRFFFSLH